jgi:YfiH family protein
MQPTDRFEWVQAAGGPALVCRPLEAIAHHLYTTRHWSLGTPTAEENGAWDQVALAAGVDRDHLVRVRQVHGAAVAVAKAGMPVADRGSLAEADIVVSDDPSVALAIQTADCVPLLIADVRRGAAAAAHAGWRGLAARVPAVAVAALGREFGSVPEDLVAASGPSISADRYEVGVDVRQHFVRQGFEPRILDRWFLPGHRPDHWQFDGWQATRDQLADAGISADRIFIASLCTATDANMFCSYRRDGSPAGRMAAVIRPRGLPPLRGNRQTNQVEIG